MCKSEKVGVFKKKWISRLQPFVTAVIRNFKQKNFKVARWNTWNRSYINDYSQEIYVPNKVNTTDPCKTLCLFACKKSTSSLTSFISSYALRSELDLSRSLASTHSTKIETFLTAMMRVFTHEKLHQILFPRILFLRILQLDWLYDISYHAHQKW